MDYHNWKIERETSTIALLDYLQVAKEDRKNIDNFFKESDEEVRKLQMEVEALRNLVNLYKGW